MASNSWEPVPRTYDPLKAGSIDGTDTIPHDHGIVRAMQAEYKPNKLVVGDPNATVFVGRLNPCTEESTLKKIFSRCGEIKRVRLVRDIVTGYSKGYAFIEFYDEHDASRARRDIDHTVIDDKEVLVDFECERILKGWIPRRLGGGFSGKKESGQLRFGCKERPFKRPFLMLKQSHDDHRENSERNSYSDRNFSRDKYSDRHREDSERNSYSNRNYSRDKYSDRHREDDHREDSERNSYSDRNYSRDKYSDRPREDDHREDSERNSYSDRNYSRDKYSDRHGSYKRSRHYD